MELHFYHPNYTKQLESYEIIKDGAKFTSHPNENILASNLHKEHYPIIGTSDGKLVTFFVLAIGEAASQYTNNDNAILFRSFSTNKDYIRQGFAKKTMELVVPFVMTHFPTKNEIILAVNLKNTKAKKLYEKVGFIDTKKRIVGPVGEQMIMRFNLKN